MLYVLLMRCALPDLSSAGSRMVSIAGQQSSVTWPHGGASACPMKPVMGYFCLCSSWHKQQLLVGFMIAHR